MHFKKEFMEIMPSFLVPGLKQCLKSEKRPTHAAPSFNAWVHLSLAFNNIEHMQA